MITYNMTADEDNKVIWFIRVTLDTFTIRACDNEFVDLVLSGNTWKHDVIKFNSISEINENIDVENGGNVGLLTNFEFEISRKVNDSNLTDFFNSLAPATSKPYITSRIVEIGVAWDTANLIDETDITWFHEFYIEDYSYDYSSMRLFCIEFAELESKELPPYEIQKDNDNNISYFENVPEEIEGTPIPIIYGDYTYNNLPYSEFSFVPIFRTSKSNANYIVACHKCDTVYTDTAYRYLESIGNVMELTGLGSASYNSYKGHYLNMSTNGTQITGEIYIQTKSSFSGVYTADGGGSFDPIDIEGLNDNSSSTFSELGVSERLALKLGTDATTAEFGNNTGIDTDLDFSILWSSSDSNTQNIEMRMFHPGSIAGSQAGFTTDFASDSTNATPKTTNFYFGFGADYYSTNPTKWTDRGDWEIEELQYIYLVVANLGTSTNSIKIYNAYLHAQNIIVFDKSLKQVDTGRLGFIIGDDRLYRDNKDYLGNTESYAYVKGKEFEGWIA